MSQFQVQLVNSTAIRLVAYNVDANQLRVIFRSGIAYDYFNVPCEIYAELTEAESVGQYFNTVIRRTYIGERLAENIASDFLFRVLEAAQGQQLLVAA